MSGLKHLLIGAAITAVIFAVLIYSAQLFGHKPAFTEKIVNRGWTNYVAVLLFFWSLSILISKMFSLRHRGRCLSANLIPDEARFETPQDIDRTVEIIIRAAQALGADAIGARFRRALEHFRATRSIKEVSDLLREESETDFAELDSSYALVRVFLWTIPILGFIGTVIGVGQAVGGFANFLSAAREIDQIKLALTDVTTGLSVAFDTTYVALVLSVVLMVITSAVEKMERNLLSHYEEYGQNQILRRLPWQGAVVPDENSNMVQQILAALMPTNEAWKKEARELTEAISVSLMKAWNKAGHEWFDALQNFQRTLAQYGQQQDKYLAKIVEEGHDLHARSTALLTSTQAMLTEERNGFREGLENGRQAFAALTQKQEGLFASQAQILVDEGKKLESFFALLQELSRTSGGHDLRTVMQNVLSALQALNPILRRLAEKPLDVQVQFTAGAARTAAE